MSTGGSVAVAFEDVEKTYAPAAGRPVRALRGVTFSVLEGEFVCLLGPSGCGKSTLLNIVAGFEHPSAGRCLVRGIEATSPGPDRGVVFQEYGVLPWMTVGQNVEFGLRAAGVAQAERERRAAAVIAKVGLVGFEHHYPKALSGGMKQRVAIGRVLAMDSAFMLMDEPFGALDALTRSALQTQLEALWLEDRKSVLFVTHNIEEALVLADRIVVMTPRPGRIRAIVPVEFPRPRRVTDAAFNDVRARVTALVTNVEVADA